MNLIGTSSKSRKHILILEGSPTNEVFGLDRPFKTFSGMNFLIECSVYPAKFLRVFHINGFS